MNDTSTTDHRQAIEELFRTKYKALIAVARKMRHPSPEDLVTATITHLSEHPGPPPEDWFKVACSRMKQVMHGDRTKVQRVDGKPTRVLNGAPDRDVALGYYGRADAGGKTDPRTNQAVPTWDPTGSEEERRLRGLLPSNPWDNTDEVVFKVVRYRRWNRMKKKDHRSNPHYREDMAGEQMLSDLLSDTEFEVVATGPIWKPVAA